MNYEWDENKYQSNLRKHGVRFEDAVPVFGDYNALEDTDSESDPSETRIVIIGLNPEKGVLVVVYCERHEDTVRIISARHATRDEEEQYEERI